MIHAPAMAAPDANIYRVNAQLWFDGAGSYEKATFDVEPDTDGSVTFRSARLTPERFDSMAIRFSGYECGSVEYGFRTIIRELPTGTHPTVLIEIPSAEPARLQVGTIWCGVGLDEIHGHGSIFYLGLRFDSVEPEQLRGRFGTGYTFTRRGEDGPFTGRITDEGFELALENTDPTPVCGGSVFRVFGELGLDGTILAVRMESTNARCPVPMTSVRLYEAPDLWTSYF